MEMRKCNLIIGTAGGTAGKGTKTYKISIPSAWVQEMELGEMNRQLEMSFDGKQITVRKAETLQDFADRNKACGHDVRIFRYYNRSTLCTMICADFTEQTLRVLNCTDYLVKTAFGKQEFPSWTEFMSFLEERCIPRTRAGLREYLECLGLDEYDPIEIIKKTSGRMLEDEQWMEMEKLS